MKRFFVTLTVSVLFFAGLSTSNAQVKNNFKMGRGIMIEKLNLSDDQLDTLNDYRFTHQEEAIDLRSEIQKNRLELRKLMSADEIDQAKIMSLTKTNNDLKNRMHESRVQMWLDIYNMLDDTQKEIWKKGAGQMGNGMKGMGQRGGFGGRGKGQSRMDSGRQNMPRMKMNPDCWRY